MSRGDKGIIEEHCKKANGTSQLLQGLDFNSDQLFQDAQFGMAG